MTGYPAFVGISASDPGRDPVWEARHGWIPLLVSGLVPDPATAVIVGRFLFYNNSLHDGWTVGASAADDGAIAPDKSALRPGQRAGFGNYSSYSRGINGVVVDLAGLPDGELLAEDFEFRSGTGPDRSAWPVTPAPQSISIRRGAGVDGADRVTIIWADGQIRKTWLEVTVRVTPRTGLRTRDRFYFGNAVGETGNSTGNAQVNSTDLNRTRLNLSASVSIGSPFDINRDGQVNSVDINLIRLNTTSFLNALPLLDLSGDPPEDASDSP